MHSSSEHIRHAYSQAAEPRARSLKAREEGLLLTAISASLAEGCAPSGCSAGAGAGGAAASPAPAAASSAATPTAAAAAATAAAAAAAAAASPAAPPWGAAAALLRGALFDRDASTHVAAVVKRGKLLAVGTNRSGNRSRGSGFSDFSLHAERAAVKALGDMSQLRGADLYVVRIPHAGHRREGQCSDLLYSRPCHECTVFLEKCMRVWGLRRVLYTTDMATMLSPPQCIKEWEASSRPPEDAAARRKWERQVKAARRRDAISTHQQLQQCAAAAAHGAAAAAAH